MSHIEDIYPVIEDDIQSGWVVQLDDGSLILMDRDMRIIENALWQSSDMGFSGEEESLEEYVDWWLCRDWACTFEFDEEAMRELKELLSAERGKNKGKGGQNDTD